MTASIPLVSPDARDAITRARSGRASAPAHLGAHLPERARALRVLDAELVAPRRLAAGAAAWAGGVAAGSGGVLAAWEGLPSAARIAGAVLGVVLALGAVRLGRQVRTVGRAVVDAFCWWSVLPRLVAHAEGRATDWTPGGGTSGVEAAVEARTWYLHPRRYLAAGLAALGGLAPLILLRLVTDAEGRFADVWPDDQDAALLVAFVGLAVPSWYAAAALFRTTSRAGSAQAQKDPVTQRLLRRD